MLQGGTAMQILLKRGQRETPLDHIRFALWTKYDVNPEEHVVLRESQAENVILARGEWLRGLCGAKWRRTSRLRRGGRQVPACQRSHRSISLFRDFRAGPVR